MKFLDKEIHIINETGQDFLIVISKCSECDGYYIKLTNNIKSDSIIEKLDDTPISINLNTKDLHIRRGGDLK